MTLVPTLINAAVVTFMGLFLWYITRSQSEQITHRVDRLEDRMDARFVRLEGEVASLRSDLTQIALAVGARTRPQTG